MKGRCNGCKEFKPKAVQKPHYISGQKLYLCENCHSGNGIEIKDNQDKGQDALRRRIKRRGVS